MNHDDPGPPDPVDPSRTVPPPPSPPEPSPARRAALKRRERRIYASSSWRAFFAELGLRFAVLAVLIVVLVTLDALR